jgi:hypothetical protein
LPVRSGNTYIAAVAFEGLFESHLTVTGGDDDELRSFAERGGAKFTRIILDRGAHQDQPMITVRGKGSADDQKALTADWTLRLAEAGYRVARVKIEAAPTNEDIPQSAALPPGSYFEHHVKLVLEDETALVTLRAIGERHSAHVSRNARRTLDNGRHQRFVTQRCYDAGQPEARRRLSALITDLETHGHTPIEIEEEFVLLDTNPQLDDGWITR